MKPKPPSNAPNPLAKTSKPLRPIKIPVRKQNGETSKSRNGKLKDDLSVLMKNISTSVTSLQEIIKLFKNATPEIIDLITNECSIILECKICKNLFRSLANFMTHKRGFCLGKFEQLFQNHEHGEHVWYSKCRKKNLLASRSTSRKDVLALIESLKRSVENESPAATVLKDMEVTNEGLINLRYFAQDPSRDKSVTIAAEETPEDVDSDLLSIDSSRCTFCHREFPTLKSLNSHLKKDHGDLRMCFVCPCCKKYFANAWSVYRHMYKVHRKTSEQVRKLRTQIQKKQVTQEELERSKRGHFSSPIEERDQEKAFMEDLKGHGSLQHCSECGKKFERKVALISHTAHCHKKSTPSTDLLRSLKRKALTPLKVDQEKKGKYTTEEMLVRLKSLDARVVLTKTELPPFITLKKEKMDDYGDERHSPKNEEEIKLLVETYQGKEDSIPPSNSNEFEDLLNKIHMEVNHVESVCITDSDRDDNDKDSVKDKNLESIEISSASEDESSQPENESQDGYNVSQEEDETENEDNLEPDSQKEDEAVSQLDDDDGECYDRRNMVFVSAGEESEVDGTEGIEEKDPLEIESDKIHEESLNKDENEKELTNSLEIVDEDQIETQEVSSVDSSLILDGDVLSQSGNERSLEIKNKKEPSFFNRSDPNLLNDSSQTQDLVETEDSSFDVQTHVHEEVVTLDTEKSNDYSEEIERTRSPSEIDDLDSNDFMGFSDVEEDTNHLSRHSINNNRNKIVLKEFERISSQSTSKNMSSDNTNDETSFLHDSSYNDLSKDGPSHEIMDDPLSERYDLEDNNYIVAKEIVLFNDSDGVCISNMSGSVDYELEALKSPFSSLENEETGTGNRYFSKLNGDSPGRLSTSPHHMDLEDEGDTMADGSDWVTKKINSLMNGQKKKCLLCFKTFHKVVFVRRHVASHYNINKFKCLVNSCNFQSFLRADMNTHVSKIHKKKELESYVGRIFPKKEDFDDSLYIADPKINYPFNKSYKELNINFDKINLVEVTEKDSKSLNSMILDEESLDGLNICREMELPCKDDNSSKLLAYETLDDDGCLSSLQEQEPGQMMMDIFGNKLGDSSQDSTLATS